MGAASTERTFQLVAGHPALDLVNTVDWRFSEEKSTELLQSYGDLLGFMEQAGLLTARQIRYLERAIGTGAATRVLKECRELREAISEFFYAQLDGRKVSGSALSALERNFKEARSHQRLVESGSGLRWDWAQEETKAEFPLWLLAMSAQELMMGHDAERLRACDKPDCRWLFLDTSKNHTRRWCDMKICGNRMKARRFKAQRKG